MDEEREKEEEGEGPMLLGVNGFSFSLSPLFIMQVCSLLSSGGGGHLLVREIPSPFSSLSLSLCLPMSHGGGTPRNSPPSFFLLLSRSSTWSRK